MELAILFWCYKEAGMCANKVRLLRHYNPCTPIYVLFGGAPAEAQRFETELLPYINDFYVFPEEKSPQWKWKHGDMDRPRPRVITPPGMSTQEAAGKAPSDAVVLGVFSQTIRATGARFSTPVAVHVTVVTPIANVVPDAGEHAGGGAVASSRSLTTGSG